MNIHRVINFEIFQGKPFLIWLYRFIYKLVTILFQYNIGIKSSWLQNRQKKFINTTLYDIYYLQNCKTITFEKITNDAKYK